MRPNDNHEEGEPTAKIESTGVNTRKCMVHLLNGQEFQCNVEEVQTESDGDSSKALSRESLMPPERIADMTPSRIRPTIGDGKRKPSRASEARSSGKEHEVPGQDKYEIIKASSIRGSDKLYDNEGYSYTFRGKKQDGTVLWYCSIHRRDHLCHAKVTQSPKGVFSNVIGHNHPGELGMKKRALKKRKIMEEAMKNPFRFSPRAVREVYEMAFEKKLDEDLPKKKRKVQKSLEPKMPLDFLIGDIHVDKAHHLVFAKTEQIQLLNKAKTWYIDANFKVDVKPFTHLFIIHAFVRDDTGDVTMLPLVFSLMSRQENKDYVEVMQCILPKLSTPAVSIIVTDFQRPLWKALLKKIPTASLKGCSIYYLRRIWEKVIEFGLVNLYHKKKSARNAIKKIMALCFLPEDIIEPIFAQMKAYDSNAKLKVLFEYVEETWICNELWNPRDWSGYQMAIRSESDMNACYDRLDIHKCTNLSCQSLISVLLVEALSMPQQLDPVSDVEMLEWKESNSKEASVKIYRLWNKYKNGKKTNRRLLKAISRLIPSPQGRFWR